MFSCGMHVLFLGLLILALQVHAQMPGMGPKSELTFKRDIPHIKCEVCNAAARRLYELAEDKRKKWKRGEEVFFDLTEKVCDTTMQSGDWTSFYDIELTEDDRLVLVDQEWYGFCRRECRTIGKACTQIFDPIAEDIAFALFENDELTADSLAERICTEWTGVCGTEEENKKQQTISAKYKNKRKMLDELYQPKTEEDVQIDWLERMANEVGEAVKFVDPDSWMEEMHEEMVNEVDWMEDDAFDENGYKDALEESTEKEEL